jgi:Tfp pilus assembly protein PilO
MNRRGPILVAAVGAVAAVLVSVLLILPKMHEVSDTQQQVNVATAKQADLTNKVAELEGLAQQADKLREQLKKFDIQVPPTADLPGLIKLLSGVAKESGVDFYEVAPGQPTPLTSPTVSEIPLSVTVNGQYFSVEEFLYHLETASRTAEITSLTLGASTSAGQSSTGIPSKAPELQAVIQVNFWTSDTSSGPGSQFGSQQGSSTSSSGSGSSSSTTTTTTTTTTPSSSPSS